MSTPVKRSSRGCVLGGAGAVLVAVMLVLWGVESVHNYFNPSPPDVKKIAESGDVVAADQAATMQLNGALTRVRTLMPWATDLGRSADDQCSTNDNIAFVGEKPKWAPVSCLRTIGWFGTFEGNFPQQLTRVNQAMIRSGWTPWGTPIDQLFQIQNGTGASPAAIHGLHANGLYTSGRQYLRVEVTQPPQQVPFSGEGLPGATTPTGTALNGPGLFTRELQPVSLTALAQEAGVAHRYMIGIELYTNYYTAPDASTSTPAATSPVGGFPCRTGSGTCVGG